VIRKIKENDNASGLVELIFRSKRRDEDNYAWNLKKRRGRSKKG
jgi:hypothetical protein